MPAPDSLTAWLARRTDDELVELLARRPDLAVPPPPDVGVLATRCGLRASVARAVDELDAFLLAVLDALVAVGADAPTDPDPAGPVDVAALVRRLGPPAGGDDVERALGALRADALVWGPDAHTAGLRVVPSLREVLPRSAAGRSSERLADADVPALLAGLDDAQRALLDSLARSSPLGRTRDAAPGAAADRPVPRLLAAGLLLKVDDGTVELPSEVAAVLRGAAAPVPVSPPTPPLRPVTRAEVDAAAAGEGLELLRHAAVLLTALGDAPAPVLRSGGIGVRELRRLGKVTRLDEARTGVVLELLAGAGLVASDEAGEPRWTPTTAVDAWSAAEPAVRWSTLARAWWELPRLPGLIGRRDERDKPLVPLSEELRRAGAPRDRRRILEVLADVAGRSGRAGSRTRTNALDADGVEQVLAWRTPRWGGRGRADLVRWTLGEATALGLVGRGALSSAGAALVAGDDPGPAMAAALPEPVDHVLIQADLTVVAPGPLEAELAAEITAVADVESAGVATVYRISPASVRRALDSGRSAAELHALFSQRSRTPVPQALSYLVDDVARRHGRLRAGVASSFLRCDDEALLAEVVASPVADRLGVRALAPTVAVSVVAVAELVTALREAGFAPAAEDAGGAILDLAPKGARVPVRRSRRRTGPAAVATAEQRETVVRGLRAGDRARSATIADRLVTDGSRANGVATVALLAQAADARRAVWIGYVDAQGVASQRVLEPVGVGGGVLEAFDPAAGALRRFALHRITSAALTET